MKKPIISICPFHLAIMVTSVCLAILIGCNPAKPGVDLPNQNDHSFAADSKDTSGFEASSSGGLSSEEDGKAINSSPAFTYSILHWNVESGGSDPVIVAAQLVELGPYDVIGLSEVDQPETFELAINNKWPDQYRFIRGLSGANEDREDDHLWMAFNREKFDLVENEEMKEVGGFVFDDGHHRVPLYVRLKDRNNGQEVVFLVNHLARGDEAFRQSQARTLREWARNKSNPVVAIGDYNLDFVFATQKGNKAFDEFMQDNVWKWVRPEPLIDTNWSDRDGDGVDNYVDSLLDFSFLAGVAKTWESSSRVIVRENDFPDTDKTSDHRPVELILKNK